MESKKKRIVILVCGAVLAGFALRLCSGEGEGHRGSAAAASSAVWAADANSLIGPESELDTGELFTRMMAAVVLVIGLGVGVVYVSKKFLPRMGAGAGRQIQITETVGLGARKALHLVEVGGRKVLIGSTAERITMLADVSDGFFDEEELRAAEAGEVS